MGTPQNNLFSDKEGLWEKLDSSSEDIIFFSTNPKVGTFHLLASNTINLENGVHGRLTPLRNFRRTKSFKIIKTKDLPLWIDTKYHSDRFYRLFR
jgi:hypothetical protein